MQAARLSLTSLTTRCNAAFTTSSHSTINRLTGVTLSSQLPQNADGTGYTANSFFGLYARETIRALEADADLSAINENCNLSGSTDADTTYQTATLSIRTVIADGIITLEITALP